MKEKACVEHVRQNCPGPATSKLETGFRFAGSIGRIDRAQPTDADGRGLYPHRFAGTGLLSAPTLRLPGKTVSCLEVSIHAR